MRVVILTEVKKKKYLKEILLLKKFLQSQNYLSSSTLQILYLKEATKVVTWFMHRYIDQNPNSNFNYHYVHRTIFENV